jgi:hypothetical protein
MVDKRIDQAEAAGALLQQEIEKITGQIAYYDDLIAGNLSVIERLNGSNAPDEAKSLIELTTESIAYCEDKRLF